MIEKSENQNSLLSLKELVSAVCGVFVGFAKSEKEFYFSSVCTDSRNVVKGSLFVPLIGQNQDGHKYIPQSIEKGATVVFVKKSVYDSNSEKYMNLAAEYTHVAFIVVANTLYALQDAAMAYVAKFPNLIKVAITGSSGKTTTKEMVVAVLKQKYNVVYTQGNFNSETGLPLSVFNIRKEHEAGVFEMGMNRKNEIAEIAAVLKPEYALITNIGTAHIGILGSRKNIAIEKRKIFKYIPENGIAFVPSDDEFSDFLTENVKGKVVFYGENVPESISGASFICDKGLNGTEFSLDGCKINLKTPGLYNYRNALGACAIGKALKVPVEKIKYALENIDSVFGRMETVPLILKNGVKVILLKDCYNANPDSMKSVLEFCASLKNVDNKVYVLGDMLELGEKSAQEHKNAVVRAIETNPAFLILIGKEMKSGYQVALNCGFKNVKYIPTYNEESIEEAGLEVLNHAKENGLVLIKASRGISLERIIKVITKTESLNE